MTEPTAGTSATPKSDADLLKEPAADPKTVAESGTAVADLKGAKVKHGGRDAVITGARTVADLHYVDTNGNIIKDANGQPQWVANVPTDELFER
jgi:hypothetical protein